jgi:hypothetical protein
MIEQNRVFGETSKSSWNLLADADLSKAKVIKT